MFLGDPNLGQVKGDLATLFNDVRSFFCDFFVVELRHKTIWNTPRVKRFVPVELHVFKMENHTNFTN